MYEYRAVVERVVDGDNVYVDLDLGVGIWLKHENVRLFGIDAPESRTSDPVEKLFGVASKRWLTNQLEPGNKIVVRTIADKGGKYGRLMAEIYLSGSNISINRQMVHMRLAVEYRGQSKGDVRLAHGHNRLALQHRYGKNLEGLHLLTD